MILGSILTLLKINLSYLERFLIKQFITAIENVRLYINVSKFEFKHTEFFLLLTDFICLTFLVSQASQAHVTSVLLVNSQESRCRVTSNR